MQRECAQRYRRVVLLSKRKPCTSHRGQLLLLIEQNANKALSIADRGYVLELEKSFCPEQAKNFLLLTKSAKQTSQREKEEVTNLPIISQAEKQEVRKKLVFLKDESKGIPI